MSQAQNKPEMVLLFFTKKWDRKCQVAMVFHEEKNHAARLLYFEGKIPNSIAQDKRFVKVVGTLDDVLKN